MARTITLKYDGTCRDCGAELLAGTLARYYGRGRIYGTECHEDSRESAARSAAGPARSAPNSARFREDIAALGLGD